jgi:hypothetical protein
VVQGVEECLGPAVDAVGEDLLAELTHPSATLGGLRG